jgi:hypothetical protein
MPVQLDYPPGRLQLFSRHGIAKRPELTPVISAGGDAVVDQATGDVYANVTAFLTENHVSPGSSFTKPRQSVARPLKA